MFFIVFYGSGIKTHHRLDACATGFGRMIGCEEEKYLSDDLAGASDCDCEFIDLVDFLFAR